MDQHPRCPAADLGDIKGALGTILRDDNGPRVNVWARLRTLLAILGPGLIAMVGDNDAGAFGGDRGWPCAAHSRAFRQVLAPSASSIFFCSTASPSSPNSSGSAWHSYLGLPNRLGVLVSAAGYTAVSPPSSTSICPVIEAAAGLTR
jgi:hypothetical protein